MNDRAEISGVILAGGRGSRLGGDDKGLVEVAGRAMVARVIERFSPQVGHLAINANRNVEQYRSFGYDVVTDKAQDFAGPLAGICAALGVCDTPLLASAPCDAPFLPLDLVDRLNDARHQSSADISVACSSGQPQPVFILIPRKFESSIIDYLADGGRKITSWYRQHNHIEVDFGPDEHPFANINAAPDIAAATALLASDD